MSGNIITLESNRCICVEDSIYFSNYYLSSKIKENVNSTIIKFDEIKFDETEFMNKSLLEGSKKKAPQGLKVTITDASPLDVLLYSKVIINPPSIVSNILENTILDLDIFNNTDQIKQFLKYDGW